VNPPPNIVILLRIFPLIGSSSNLAVVSAGLIGCL
jgi:hypothetical protein